MDELAKTSGSVYGPKQRPSWRVLLRRIAVGELVVSPSALAHDGEPVNLVTDDGKVIGRVAGPMTIESLAHRRANAAPIPKPGSKPKKSP